MDKIYNYNLEEIYKIIMPFMEEAGELALEIRQFKYDVKEKTKNDFVTEADIAVQNYLQKHLAVIFPQIDFMAEEELNSVKESSEYIWIIDPIDGTTNFMHQIENGWAISVALAKLNKENLLEPVLGIVYKPDSKDYFYAIKNQGAFEFKQNTQKLTKLSVSNEKDLGRALVVFGANRSVEHAQKMYEILKELSPKVAGIRRRGGASLDICEVAKGIFVSSFEFSLQPWDIAAAMLVLTEAGGVCSTLDNKPIKIEKTSFVSGNTHMHKIILEMFHK